MSPEELFQHHKDCATYYSPFGPKADLVEFHEGAANCVRHIIAERRMLAKAFLAVRAYQTHDANSFEMNHKTEFELCKAIMERS